MIEANMGESGRGRAIERGRNVMASSGLSIVWSSQFEGKNVRRSFGQLLNGKM